MGVAEPVVPSRDNGGSSALVAVGLDQGGFAKLETFAKKHCY
jgi:hypothetical protein